MTPARNRRTTTVTDVASFTVDDELQHPADFFLIRDGGVALFLGNQVLEQAQAELALLGYTDVRVDLGRGELERVHDQFSSNLAFPDYYGRNLDALNDCLGDVARGDYGWDATTTGLAVTVYRFSQLHGQHPQVALALADIIVGMSRYGLLFGHRIVSLLQVDEPDFKLGPVGGIKVTWNYQQWNSSQRTPPDP